MDIVKQLQNRPELTPAQYWEAQASMWHENYKEAADEIERLRKALKIFADNVKETNVGIDKYWAETVYALKTENQRLREALRKYADDEYNGYNANGGHARDAIAKATGGE